ncbi:MAG TPA: hypothetical protein PJ997_02095 [Candidatus Paceibacterota bacterium]|nr:hypothetical protein [Candidatus Paceibacterota bacterium]HMP19107.1 hypothetical protein [Candidatus Paceibacterota bacterium]HMP85111.1 hypothetical protein [Candidatus Paceibacterota bacterium]
MSLKMFFLICFLIWSFPFFKFRTNFRKLVYDTNSWKISIKPVFWLEIKGLFFNIYPEKEEYVKVRNFYRFYLIIYLILFGIYWSFD